MPQFQLPGVPAVGVDLDLQYTALLRQEPDEMHEELTSF